MPKWVFAFIAIACLFASSAQAMTSTNFTINWDSVNSGGDDISSSTNYRIRDTIGEQAVGESSSTSFTIRAGYRQGDTDATVLSFDIGTQENSTETAYGSFDNAGKTVTVSSTASFTTSSFIGVVENKGLTQIIAVGKIVSVGGGIITVDRWDGNPSALSATPSGGDDFVYRLSGDAAQLGTLTSTTGATSLTHTSISTNVAAGYTLYANTDGNLRSGSDTIDDVSDGAVTIGSEEYGARVYGTTATSTGSDFSLTTTNRAIQQSATFADDDRIGLIYKAAISSGTAAGSYSQLVFYTVTANF